MNNMTITRALRIGSRVNNSTANSILFIDSDGNLAENNSALSWTDSTSALNVDGSATFNDSSADKDFLIKSQLADIFFSDASTNRIGVNCNPPQAMYDIVGLKPPLTSSSNGTSADTVSQILGGQGGDSNWSSFIVQGGTGGGINYQSGNGGVSSNATNFNRGGAGGSFTFRAGGGGTPGSTNKTNIGGSGGLFQALGGTGGFANGAGTATNTGGTGSTVSFVGGAGGVAFNGSIANGGAGGKLSLSAGNGGNATNATTNNGGMGGDVNISSGSAGTGSTSNGTDGDIPFTTGTTLRMLIQGSDGRIGINKSSSINAQVHIQSNTTTTPTQILQAIASQSVNIFEAQDSAGTVLASIDESGGFVFNENGLDADCRIEGNGDANLFYTDAGNDSVGIRTATPNSTLQISGSISTPVSTKTTTYTLTETDNILLGDATSATFTITLPTAVGINGRRYTIKKTDSSINFVTVDGDGSETIDGDTSFDLELQDEVIEVVSNGNNWAII